MKIKERLTCAFHTAYDRTTKATIINNANTVKAKSRSPICACIVSHSIGERVVVAGVVRRAKAFAHGSPTHIPAGAATINVGTRLCTTHCQTIITTITVQGSRHNQVVHCVQADVVYNKFQDSMSCTTASAGYGVLLTDSLGLLLVSSGSNSLFCMLPNTFPLPLQRILILAAGALASGQQSWGFYRSD